MITNEVQYRATTAHLAKFEEAISNLEHAESTDHKLHELQLAALRSQADDLREELAQYEALRSGALTTFEVSSLGELAEALVKARLARGWTQRRLAEQLGVAEQQVQRYEATGYASASLSRLSDIATALGLVVHQIISLEIDSVGIHDRS